jgi:arylsulfatase A-like enzyme
VTDAAFAYMDHEDWSGLMLTYGGIDKAGHMWGGLNDRKPYPGGDKATHMAAMARVADEQVGRVVARLKKDKLLDDTLIVLTTDHAQQTSTDFYGTDGAGRGNLNWYYGNDADETYLAPQPEIQRLIDETGDNVEMSMQDSAIRTWLKDSSPAAMNQAADVMATLGGVRASYVRDGDHYVLRHRAPASAFGAGELRWFDAHAQEIVDTEAATYGPDVIGLLANGSGYGVKGDHGGAQESVQRIPIVLSGPGVEPGSTSGAAMRSVDILPTVLAELGVAPIHPMDGRAVAVPGT